MSRFLFILALLLPLHAFAKNVADVHYPETVTLPGYNKPLKINGAGIRYKFFFKIYTAALYVEQPANTMEAILNQPGAKRLHLVILHDEVSRQKMIDATIKGFEDNLSDAEQKELAQEISAFYQLYETVHEGDELIFDYIPDKGTSFTFKGEEKGVIPGDKFNQAVLKIWIGKYPATDSLKRDLLGQEESD